MDCIKLTQEEKNSIVNNYKYIGSGVDGSIYKMNNNTVYKFYHDTKDYITVSANATYDSEGVNISNFKDLRNNGIRHDNRMFKYTDKDGVILGREDAIRKAIEKQENVKLTSLPKQAIYVNNKIAGCSYEYYPNKLGIYSTAYLPLKLKLKVCEKLLLKVKELIDNNIYPVTLAQHSDKYPASKNNSNVLIGLDLDPKIVDLDGLSAFYSESFSKNYYNRSMTSLSTLIIEILCGMDLNFERIDEENIDEYATYLVEKHIPKNYVTKYLDYSRLDIQDLDDIVKRLKK